MKTIRLKIIRTIGYGSYTNKELKEYLKRQAEVSFMAGIREATSPDFLYVCKVALEHMNELAEAWQRGALHELDGKGGTRSNRNVDIIAKPVNPHPKDIIDEATGQVFTDKEWQAWERCQKEMDEYYGETLLDAIGELDWAQWHINELLDGRSGNLRYALAFIGKAAVKIAKVVNGEVG